MPVLPNTADILTRHLPKLFSPRAHRAADYALGASFALAGAWFWRRNRRAAAASWMCAGSIVGLTLVTRYPDRKKGLIDFRLHGKLDVALAALVGTMPEFLGSPGHAERHYFRTKAAILTLIANLTSFTVQEDKKYI